MFSKKEKPLPQPTVKPPESSPDEPIEDDSGIEIGRNYYWDPASLSNGHVAIIGASGSGKTQTLKSIAHSLEQNYPTLKLYLIDFHGDQSIAGETVYRLHATSEYGVNPLIINLDPEGGGPDLQSIEITSQIKKSLLLGANQQGVLLDIINSCYKMRGILNEDQSTWHNAPPNFKDVEDEVRHRAEDEDCKESQKLQLKLAVLFKYGVFSRPQFPDEGRGGEESHSTLSPSKIIRIDLSKLPHAIASLAAESVAKQLMNNHRLLGEASTPMPSTYLFIDECKEMPTGRDSACNRITQDGRKFGLSLVMASQSERHMSSEVIGNSATKIVLPVDSSEVQKVAKKFRFSEHHIAKLTQLNALIRAGVRAEVVPIIPYYEKVK